MDTGLNSLGDIESDVMGRHATLGGTDLYMYSETFPTGIHLVDDPELGMWVVSVGGIITATDPVSFVFD